MDWRSAWPSIDVATLGAEWAGIADADFLEAGNEDYISVIQERPALLTALLGKTIRTLIRRLPRKARLLQLGRVGSSLRPTARSVTPLSGM